MPDPIEITVYTTRTCPYCRRAKKLLERCGLAFHEIPVDADLEARAQMTRRTHGCHTVPQIFFGDHHIGGCDDLYDLHASGELDLLLADRA